MIHLSHNPDKLEAKALDYERKGKTAKAIKYREKAARLRSQHGGAPGQLGLAQNPIPVGQHPVSMLPPGGLASNIRPTGVPVVGAGGVPLNRGPRTPAMYEANALKWEQRGNWDKAQKNREKVWRLRNPQHQTAPAPRFYRDNSFLGYELLPSTTSNLQQPLLGQGGHGVQHFAQQPLLGQGGHGVQQHGLTSLAQPLLGQGGHGVQHVVPQGYPVGGHGLKKRDPALIEAKAAEYDRRGKTAKANKLRNKAAQVRAGTYAPTRTPATYERNALKWEQRNNWDKAQKNRAKYWRHQNPQYVSHQAPAFYNGGRFLGYNVPVAGFNQGAAPLGLHGASPVSQFDFARPSRDPARLEQRAAEWDARGKPQKAQRLRNKAAQIRAGSYTSQRSPQLYERNALKWEQRGNYEKAQKNRAKAWRLQNPQYAQHVGPSFYNGNSFLGYSVPFTASQSTLLPYYRSVTTTQTTSAPGGWGAIPSGVPVGGAAPHGLAGILSSRDPERLEARALAAERKGKPQKALKLREKAARIRGGNHTYRTIPTMETKALHWEQQGQWKRAQKQRTKIWRLQNPQYISSTSVPTFYNNNVFLGYNVPFSPVGVSGVTSSLSQVSLTSHTVYAAPIVEQIVRPVVVTETQRPERIIEVQPIIHREVEAPTIKIIEQHVYETVPSVGPSTITNAAIVHETITPMITEEVIPIVHREVPAPFVERVEQHVTEHIVQPVVTTKEVIQDTTVHAVSAGAPLVGVHQQTHLGGSVLGVQQQTYVGAPVVTEQTTVTTTTSQQPTLF